MKQNITRKVLQSHLIEGKMVAGEEISIKIDQTLTQDATGTMAYLSFEALGLPKVRTEVSVSYVDHNTLQAGFENADDHAFLQTISEIWNLLFKTRKRDLPSSTLRKICCAGKNFIRLR
ncbi:hypothetical protein ACFQDF_26140 [Ectobacillus funiculus]